MGVAAGSIAAAAVASVPTATTAAVGAGSLASVAGTAGGLTAAQAGGLALGGAQLGAGLFGGGGGGGGGQQPYQGRGPAAQVPDYFTPLLNALMANALSTVAPPGPIISGF